MPEPTIIERTYTRAYSLGVLAVAAVTFPYVVAYCLAAAAYHRLFATTTAPPSNGKTVIITGGKMTKSLHLIRHLKAAGCRVVLCETGKYWMVASRFSSCVDRFVTTPVPEKATKEHLSSIKQLAYEEDADLFVPVTSPLHSVYEARASTVLPASCRALALSEAVTAALDDKVTFAELAKQAGVAVPDIRRVTSKSEAHKINDELRATPNCVKHIFKSINYDSMRRLDLFTMPCEPSALDEYLEGVEITPNASWGVQKFVTGTEYATCAISHNGNLALYTDHQTSISCFNYEHVGDPRLKAWVTQFCKYHKITGVVCIDFFIDTEGNALAIECNPRWSSNIANFYDEPTAVGKALLEPEACAAAGEVATPLPTAVETNWIGADVYYALTKPGKTLSQRASALYAAFALKKDAYYDPADIVPFLALYYLHIPTLLLRNVWKGNRWAKIDLCIGKLTEENGD